jgi:hypothetical protein
MPPDDILLEPWPYKQPEPSAAKPDITKAVADATDRVVAARVVHQMIREGRVSKLAAIADRIKEKKLAYDKKADEWAQRLDALERREPDAFAVGDSVVSERETDLSDMESTMKAISNLPNVSAKS